MIRIALVWLTIVLLSGCFEVSQSVVIADGHVEYDMNIGLSAQLAAMGAKENGSSTQDFCKSDDFVNTDIPDGMTAVAASRFEDDFLICNVNIQGSLEDFGELSAQMSQKDQDAKLIEVEILPNNQLRLISEFDFEGQDDGDEIAEGMKAMVASAFTGRALRWTVTAPEIISTNGTVSDDGTTASWEVPLSVAFMEGGNYRFEVVLVHTKPWWEVW